jgi:hypothetical protein
MGLELSCRNPLAPNPSIGIAFTQNITGRKYEKQQPSKDNFPDRMQATSGSSNYLVFR